MVCSSCVETEDRRARAAVGPGGIFIDGRAMSRTEHSGSVAGSPGQRECESVIVGPKPAGVRLP